MEQSKKRKGKPLIASEPTKRKRERERETGSEEELFSPDDVEETLVKM